MAAAAAAKLSTICFFPQQTGSLSHRETTQARTGTSIGICRELSERGLLAIYLVEWLHAYAMYPVWVIIFSSVKSFIISDIKMKKKDARKHTWPRKARWKYHRSGTFHCKNIFVVWHIVQRITIIAKMFLFTCETVSSAGHSSSRQVYANSLLSVR